MKRFDSFQAPGLAFLAFGLAPANRFPIGRENQTRSGITNLHAVPAGFIHIQKKSLLDSVLVRTGLDVDTIFQADIRGQQHFFPAINRVCYMVKSSLRSGVVARVGEVIAFIRARHPQGGFRSVIKDNLLRQAKAKILFEELAIGLDVNGQAVPMVEAADIDATRGKALGLILQRRPQVRWSFIPLGFVVELDPVPVGILAEKCWPVCEVAIRPSDIEARSFETATRRSSACGLRVR